MLPFHFGTGPPSKKSFRLTFGPTIAIRGSAHLHSVSGSALMPVLRQLPFRSEMPPDTIAT